MKSVFIHIENTPEEAKEFSIGKCLMYIFYFPEDKYLADTKENRYNQTKLDYYNFQDMRYSEYTVECYHDWMKALKKMKAKVEIIITDI